MTMPIDAIIGAFQDYRYSSEPQDVIESNRLWRAMNAAIPILRRAKELDVELLKRVVEKDSQGQRIHMSLAKRKSPGEAYHAGNAACADFILAMISSPETLQAEAKRLGLEVEE